MAFWEAVDKSALCPEPGWQEGRLGMQASMSLARPARSLPALNRDALGTGNLGILCVSGLCVLSSWCVLLLQGPLQSPTKGALGGAGCCVGHTEPPGAVCVLWK